MKHTADTIGEMVRTTRKSMKLTQPDLALTSGTGLRFIVDLENGKPTCQIGKALQVLNALGISIQLIPPKTN